MGLKVNFNKFKNIKIIHRNISKGFFLVFTLLLVSLVTVSCLVMVNITQTSKSSSDASQLSANLTQLANQNVQAIAATLNVANNGIMKHLDLYNGNIYFVTVFPVTDVIKMQCKLKPPNNQDKYSCLGPLDDNTLSSIADLNTYIFDAGKIVLTPKNVVGSTTSNNDIIPPTGITFPADQARIIQKNYSAKGAIATYTLNISQTVCSNDANGQTVCQAQNGDFEFTRTCPGSLNRNRSMRALTDAEIKTIAGTIPAGQSYHVNNSFPNLYCTCADANYPLTTSQGTCCGVGCLFSDAMGCYAPLGSSGSDATWGSEGLYMDADEICQPCIKGCYECTNGSTCSKCYQTGKDNGYVINSTGQCQACGAMYFTRSYYSQPSGPSSSYCTSCSSPCYNCFGGRSDQCVSCQAGYFKVGSFCFPCVPGLYATAGNSSSSCKPNTSANCEIKSTKDNVCLKCLPYSSFNPIRWADSAYFLYNGQCYPCPKSKTRNIPGTFAKASCQCYDGISVWKDWHFIRGVAGPTDDLKIGTNDPNNQKFWDDNC